MKALKFTLIIPLLVFAVSCKKSGTSDNNNTKSAVTSDEAVDMAVGAISVNSFGFASVADNVGANAQTFNSISTGSQTVNSTTTNSVHQACGTTVADSIDFSGNTASVTYSSFYKFSRTLNCNTNNVPDNLINAITFKGSFDGPRLSSNDSGTSNVTIAGLAPSAASYTVNGTYSRKGAFTSKVGNKASGSSDVEIVANNVVLNKPGRAIASGTATITISGTAHAGSFSFAGTLVFNGNNKATLTVGTTVYIVNLLTGSYTKQ